MADLHQRVESLFDKHVVRVVLERVDGELLVTEVEFATEEAGVERQQPAASSLRVRERK